MCDSFPKGNVLVFMEYEDISVSLSGVQFRGNYVLFLATMLRCQKLED